MAAIIISTIQPRMISLQIGFFGDIRRICIIFFYVLSGTLFDIRQPLAYGKDNNKLLTTPYNGLFNYFHYYYHHYYYYHYYYKNNSINDKSNNNTNNNMNNNTNILKDSKG